MAFRNIGALWAKKGKEGKPFLSGMINNRVFGDVHIMVFPNDSEHRSEKSPGYRIVMVTDDEGERRDKPQQSDDFFGDGDAPDPQDVGTVDADDSLPY
jgi:hypothetical protein